MEKCIHGCNKTGCSGIIYMKRGESMQKNAPSGKLTTAERDASLDPVSYTHLTLPTTPYV